MTMTAAGLAAISTFALLPLIVVDDNKLRLPLKMHQPFGNEDSSYWYYYAIEILCLLSSACIIIGHDLFYLEFLLFVCHQFEILESRLQLVSIIATLPKLDKTKFAMENQLISKLKRHHQLIFQ